VARRPDMLGAIALWSRVALILECLRIGRQWR
jgi:hypothetical protein